MKRYYRANIVSTQDGTGDCLIELDQDMLKDLGWNYDDELSIAVKDGAIVLRNVSHETRERSNNRN